MTTAIVIPWDDRVGCPHRSRALDFVRGRIQLEHPEKELVIGRCNDGEWSKGVAIADALKRTNAEVLILWDADVWVKPESINEATINLRSGWAIPHRLVHRLGAFATERVYTSNDVRCWGRDYDRLPYEGMPAGGLVIVARELYEEAPFDPRFRGWGHEDEAAGRVWQQLGGIPWRGGANLWHLWHPPQPKLSKAVGSKVSWELLRRYRQAGTIDRVKTIIEEAR